MRAAILIALLGLTSPAVAADLGNAPLAGDRRILSHLSVEPHAVAGLGYQHGLSVRGHALALSAHLDLPLYLLDGHHHRLALAARSPVLLRGPWRLDARVQVQEQSTDSALFRGTALGLGAGLWGGFSRPGGWVGLDLGLRGNPATWMRPTDDVGPTGWYGATGGFVELGLGGGLTLARRVEVGARVGVDRTLAGGSRTAPLAAGLGVDLLL